MKKFKKAASITLALLLVLGMGNISALAADETLLNTEETPSVSAPLDSVDNTADTSSDNTTDDSQNPSNPTDEDGNTESTPSDNAPVLKGEVTALTDGAKLDENTVTFGVASTLAYSAEGNEEGRTPDCWWAGIKMNAPEGTSNDAQYRKITQWWNDADGTSTTWGAATPWRDNVDGTFWVPVKPEYFSSYGDTLNYRYQFDWDGDGSYEQEVVVKVTKNVKLSGIDAGHVARIGGQGYVKLQNAMNKAKDGETVQVLKDTAGANLITAKHITVNVPAGVTVTGSSYGLLAQNAGAELTITGNGTVKGGTYGVVSQKSGTVNINGGTIEGDSYGVYAATNAP